MHRTRKESCRNVWEEENGVGRVSKESCCALPQGCKEGDKGRRWGGGGGGHCRINKTKKK
jgi:hypothetical protein